MFGYNFKLKWEGKNVKVEAGDNFSADIDTKAVAGVLAGVGSVVVKDKDVSLLMKLSAASVATYLAVKGAKKAWSWLDATVPPTSDILQLSAPKDKKSEFDRLIDEGELEKTMKETLQNPKQAIRNDLGDSVSETTVDELVKKLDDLHLSSLTKCTDEHGGVQGAVVKGKLKVETQDHLEIIAPISGSGNVVGARIEKGAEAHYVHRGGVQMIGGISSDVQKYAIDSTAGNKLKVSLKYSDYSPKFEGRYRPDQTVYDIIVDVMKEKKDKKFIHIKSKSGEVIDEDTKISALKEKGILELLTAVVE